MKIIIKRKKKKELKLKGHLTGKDNYGKITLIKIET